MNKSVKLTLTHLAQATLALLIVLEFVALQADFTTKQTALLVLSLLFAVIPLGLLWEARSILNKASKRIKAAKLGPKKLSALDALGTKSLSLVQPITQTLTSDMKINEFLIGRKQYSPKDAAIKSLDLFASAVKAVKVGIDPEVVNTSKPLKHGRQEIVFISGPAATVLESSTDLWDHGHVRKLTASDRKFIKTHSDKKQTIGVYALALGYRLANEESVTLLGLITMTDPRAVALPELSTTQAHLTRQAVVRAIRTNLTSGSSQLALVVLGVAGLAAYHLPPAITFMQIIALDLLLCAPIAALAYEKNYLKLNKIRWQTPVAFGILAALIGFANYLFFFARHNLSPFYIDPGLPMYHQATSLTLLTILFCVLAYLLFERADHHEQFFTEHLHSNDKLLQGFGLSLVLLAAIIYLPWLQPIFSTAPLDIVDWASALLAACVYALLRLLQRHTRKHSRHAVLKLHDQTH